jgi:DNA-binding CsgD family transcriptional regulator
VGTTIGVAPSWKQSIGVEALVHYLITYSPMPPVEAELLTTRQREVFQLIVVGLSNKEIARKLAIREGTVKIHVAKLFDKLGVRHRSAVALAGVKLGLRPAATVFAQRGRIMSQAALAEVATRAMPLRKIV